MVPNPDFKPDENDKHLPQCKRCVDRGLPCLEGPGKACYECNQASASCKDWDPPDSDEDQPREYLPADR